MQIRVVILIGQLTYLEIGKIGQVNLTVVLGLRGGQTLRLGASQRLPAGRLDQCLRAAALATPIFAWSFGHDSHAVDRVHLFSGSDCCFRKCTMTNSSFLTYCISWTFTISISIAVPRNCTRTAEIASDELVKCAQPLHAIPTCFLLVQFVSPNR